MARYKVSISVANRCGTATNGYRLHPVYRTNLKEISALNSTPPLTFLRNWRSHCEFRNKKQRLTGSKSETERSFRAFESFILAALKTSLFKLAWKPHWTPKAFALPHSDTYRRFRSESSFRFWPACSRRCTGTGPHRSALEKLEIVYPKKLLLCGQIFFH